MKITVIGGGAWGTTIAQVLNDNNHEVLIYEINETYINKINDEGVHPIFGIKLDSSIKATKELDEAIKFSNYLVLAVPTKATRIVLNEINKVLTEKTYFINISKGIEPETSKLISEIVEEEINPNYFGGFVCLTGPSHAEETIERKLTVLVSASNDKDLAVKVQHLVSNKKYLRVYTSCDLRGSEVGGAVKNAIAVISGMAAGYGLGENARAAIITRGILEIVKVVEIMGGNKETAFGLTGIGDLIVTASSTQSRNFQGGKKIGEGLTVDEIYASATQTIEGFRTIEALHNLSIKNNIELPLINTAFDVLKNKITVSEAIELLLNRTLKAEEIDKMA